MPDVRSRQAQDTHWVGVRSSSVGEGSATRSDGSSLSGPATVWADPPKDEGETVAPQAKPSTPLAPALTAPPERNEWSEEEGKEVVRQALLSGLSIFVSPVLPRGTMWTFHSPDLLMVSQGDFEAGRAHTVAYLESLKDTGLVVGDPEILRTPAFALASINIT